MIVQRLRAIQDEHGFLPDDELKKFAKETGTPLSKIQDVAGFFPHFRQEWNKPPSVEVKVCRDMACHLRGAPKILSVLKHSEKKGELEVEGVSCLGRCDRAVACLVSRNVGNHPFHDYLYTGRTAYEMESVVSSVCDGLNVAGVVMTRTSLFDMVLGRGDQPKKHSDHPPPQPDRDADFYIDRTDWQIDPYAEGSDFAGKRYEAVERFVREFPNPVLPPPRKADGKRPSGKALEEYVEKNHPWLKRLGDSGLVGMGGAGMPAYAKWSEVWMQSGEDRPGEKYIVVNGDESEPSTFKDRELLLHLPHTVVEGVILAGLLTNASRGYIFIRHEYREQIRAVEGEIERAEKLGACGEGIFGTGRSFPVEVFVSPGGYICGEQSALIEAMEDRRAQPRNKPPELLTNGLRDRPTVVNNVETIAWTPAILLRREPWYQREWIEGSGYVGRRLFSLCGDVENPGVFEVPNGTTLGDLIDRAGGMRGGKPLKAVALSGPSGGLVPGSVPASGYEARLQKQLKRIDDNLAATVKENLEREKDEAKRERKDAEETAKAKKERQKFVSFIERASSPDKTRLDLKQLPLDKAILGPLSAVTGYEFMLGAGLAVYADPCDVLDQAVQFTEFFRNESCGKCVPCRIGSQKLAEIGHDLLARRKRGERIPLGTIRQDVVDLYEAISITSICGLGQVAGNPLAKALIYFGDEIAPPETV